MSGKSTLQEVIQRIDETAARGCLVVDASGCLLGLVTDGDLRRGLLRGATLADSVETIMNTSVTTASADTTDEEALHIMLRESIAQLPVVNQAGVLTSVFLLSELMRPPKRGNPVIIMAGGRGERLGELTSSTPKPMLNVQGRPMLEIVLSNCLAYGFENFIFCVHYLSDAIKEYFGDGSRWGARIDYIEEDVPMGTSGAVGLAAPASTFLVINADVINKVDLTQLLQAHESTNALATVCLHRQHLSLPYGVVDLVDSRIVSINEKPDLTHFVNAGIYVLEPQILDYIPRGAPSDMTDVLAEILRLGHLVQGFPIFEFWMDLGDHESLRRANAHSL